MQLYQELDDRYNQSNTFDRIGDTRSAMGDVPQAREAWRRAVALLDELEHPDAGRVRAKLERA